MKDENGYRPIIGAGPRVRTDVVDVYVFRRGGRSGNTAEGGVEFLQILRARNPLMGTWHPVMGHVESGETAAQCAMRELREEVGLDEGSAMMRGVWALEQVHPFFIAAIDSIVMSPRFAAEVDGAWTPTLNAEHTAHRWVSAAAIDEMFMWPGQRAACREVLSEIVREGSLSRERLRVK